MSLCESIQKEYRDNFIKIIFSLEFIDLYFSYKKCKNKYNKLLNYINKILICNNVDKLDLYDCICNIVRKEDNKLIEKILNSNTFYCIYKKYNKKHINYTDLINYIDNKIKCLNIDCSECYKYYLPKTIALLELTGGFISNDVTVKNTFQYYWNNYSQEFLKFPIVDTGGNIDKTTKLLEKYYNLGYRYFVGFSRSTIVSAELEWFNMHADAIGISPTSTAPVLNIPKNIYRITATDNYIIEPILPKLYESQTVYYIYSEDEVATLNILFILENDNNIKNLKTFAVNSTNMTLENMKLFLDGSTEFDSIVLYIINNRDTYIDLYSKGLTFPGQQYDILGITSPIIPEGAVAELTNKYNIIVFKGVQTSKLWRSQSRSMMPCSRYQSRASVQQSCTAHTH
jgi:hypothetical protein